jgi:type II secretory pathway pseudopilin PulG
MRKHQTGQTLIETMVAVFIMVMGITAALGLANYSLNASTSIRRQIIGTGLAREGLEAVKNMRDTNWLNGQLASDCYDFAAGSPTGGSCYHDWLNPTGGYNFQLGSVTRNYRLAFDGTATSANGFWVLSSQLGNAWGLDNSTNPNQGLYVSNANPSGTSGFYRKIIISPDATAPFDKPNFERLLVTSQVWWTDKNCPPSADWPGSNKCSIMFQSYLTNWKTY